jgi:hypothetical protein
MKKLLNRVIQDCVLKCNVGFVPAMESESTRVEHLTLLLLMNTQILGGP